MANENQNTGPQNTGSSGVDANKLRQNLKDLLQDQGDYNNLLKDSIKYIGSLDTAYTRILSRISTLNKDTVNVKQLNQELSRLAQKQYVTDKNRSDLQARVSEDAKRLVDFAMKESRSKEDALNFLKAQGDLEAVALYTAEQAYELAKKNYELGQEELDKEKEVAKRVGVTGNILKLSSKYLGVGKDLYGKIVEEAREGVSTTSNWVKGLGIAAVAITAVFKGLQAAVGILKGGLDSLTGTGGPVSKFISPFNDLIKSIPVIGGLIGSVVEMGANIIDFAIGATSEIQGFARSLGLSVGEATQINKEFAIFAINSQQAFLNADKLRKSQLELSKALGINNVLNNQILADNLQLQEQVGLELETRKQLAELALISDKRQTQIFKSIAGQVAAIKNSLGVNLRVQDVIANISKLTGVVGLTFAKYPEKLAKSLAITKALGLDFQKLDSIASGLLDFESSIASEFEAQLITGKDINLAKARQLALDNDLTGLAVELNKQLGSSNDFLNMNRIAQESYAKALGMSRDEIADMLRQQELFAAAGATDLKTFKDRIVAMERAGTLQSEFISKLNEEQAQYFLSSTATEKIANFMEQIRQSFASLLSNPTFQQFLDTFLNKLSDPNFLTGIIDKLVGFVSLILKSVAAIVDVADVVGNVFSLGNVDISNDIPNSLRSLANNIGGFSIGGKVASSQVNTSGGGNFVPQPAAASSSPNLQAINLTVQAVVEDHAKRMQSRIGLAPQGDYKTGPYGKQ